jgi:hypothetical protein
LSISIEERAHGIEVARLGRLDQALLFFELDGVGGFSGHEQILGSTQGAAKAYTAFG